MATEKRKWERTLREKERDFSHLVTSLNVILEVDRHLFETSFSLKDLLDEMLKGTRQLTDGRFAQILLRRGNALEIVNSTDPAHCGHTFPVDSCVSGIAVERGEPVISGNVQRDFGPRYRAMLGSRKTPMRSEVAVPIKSPPPHSVTVGVLNVESPHEDAFDASDRDIIVQFARQAGAAIHAARFRDALQLTLDLAKYVRTSSPQKAIRTVLKKLNRFFNQEVEIQFLLYERKTNTLVIEVSTKRETEGVRVLVERSFCGRVVRQRQPLFSNNVRVEYAEDFQDTLGGTESELAVPIFDSENNVTGVLNVESSMRDAFGNHDLYLLSVLAGAGVWHRLREMRRARAIENMAAIGDVAANVIHILNNALTPIDVRRSKLAALAPRGGVSEEFNQELEALQKILSDVTDRMTDLDRKYKNALRGNTPMDINRVVAEKQNIITRRDVVFSMELDPEMPTLQLPPTIADVLWNLISNAYQAIPKNVPAKSPFAPG